MSRPYRLRPHAGARGCALQQRPGVIGYWEPKTEQPRIPHPKKSCSSTPHPGHTGLGKASPTAPSRSEAADGARGRLKTCRDVDFESPSQLGKKLRIPSLRQCLGRARPGGRHWGWDGLDIPTWIGRLGADAYQLCSTSDLISGQLSGGQAGSAAPARPWRTLRGPWAWRPAALSPMGRLAWRLAAPEGEKAVPNKTTKTRQPKFASSFFLSFVPCRCVPIYAFLPSSFLISSAYM